MKPENEVCVSFKIKRFTSSKDADFIEALKIYDKKTEYTVKTSTNEITEFIDNPQNKKREMYFFGLYRNNNIIGFIEAAYLKTTTAVMIDYIVMDDGNFINGVFYPIFSLFQRYFIDNSIPVGYFLMEVNTTKLKDKVSNHFQTLIRAENFGIADALYIQPQLGLHNVESNYEMCLAINAQKRKIKIKTYLNIVNDIYYNHYVDWYSKFLTSDEMREYEKIVKDDYKKIEKSMEESIEDNIDENEKMIKISNPVFDCDYYTSNECHYSTAGPFNDLPVKNKLSMPLKVLLAVTGSLALTIGLSFLMDMLNIPLEGFGATLAAVLAFPAVFILLFRKKFKD
jgi:hypothetical protein